MSLNITLAFGGGAELLFGNVKEQKVTLEKVEEQWTIKTLLVWIKDNLLQHSPAMFIQGDTIRPGIMVLVNDTDWELLDKNEYVIEDGDIITFISTLHGG